MKKLFLRVGQRLFLGFIHLQIYNHEQTKNSPSGHPTRKKKLWIATSQSAEHPPNAAPPFAPLGQVPAATSRFLLLPPFRCRHLRRHPFGRPLHPPRRMRHRRQTAGALGAFASVPSRPLRGLCLRSLRSFADDAPQSLRSRVCQPVVRNGEAGNGYTPFAALCGRTDQQNAGVEAHHHKFPQHTVHSPMSDKEKTKLVTLSRREVASKIFPDYDSRKAVSALTRWIQQDPILFSRLLKRGYRPRMRVFSPNIQRVLQKYIGY